MAKRQQWLQQHNHRAKVRTTFLGCALLGAMVFAQSGFAQGSMDFEPEEVKEEEPGFEVEDGPNEPEQPKTSLAIGNDREELKAIYGDDPLFGTKLTMERHMGIYLLRHPQRDETEKIAIKRKGVTASVWVSIGSREENDLVCRAVEWLVFGRTHWSLGARGIFSDFQDVQNITLVFTNVRLRDGRKGRVKKKVHPYLELMLTRRDFNKLDPKALKESLESGKCSEVARRTMSRLKFNDRYFNEFKANR